VQILGAGPNWYLGVNCSIGISNTMAHVCPVPDFVRVNPREFNFYYKKNKLASNN
jgi:copper homeostasis protein CutC